MGFIRDWWILVWWGEAVKARSVQEGKREIRTGAIRTGSQGSVLSLWDRCVLVGHGSTGSNWKGVYWPGKFRLGRKCAKEGMSLVSTGAERLGRKCAEDWTGVSGTERWGLAGSVQRRGFVRTR